MVVVDNVVGSGLDMTVTSADFLLNFFDIEKDREPVRFAELASAMCEVDNLLRSAALHDPEAALVAELLPELWARLTRARERSSNSESVVSDSSLTRECRLTLLAAKRLSRCAFEYSAERRSSIQAMLDDIPNLLKDLEIKDDLQQYIMLLTSEVRLSLDTFEVTGRFSLDQSFSRLTAVVNSLMVTPTTPKKFERLRKFFTEKFVPAVRIAGFTLGAPVALDDAVDSSVHLLEGAAALASTFVSDTGQSDQQ